MPTKMKKKMKSSPRAAGRPSVGARLIDGLTQVRDALRSGEPMEKRFTVRTVEIPEEPGVYQPADVRAVRETLNVSQALFAKMIGASGILVRSWESGQRVPSPMARRLLDMIRRRPEDLAVVIRKRRGPAAPAPAQSFRIGEPSERSTRARAS